MFNLLPQNFKELIRNDYKKRHIIVLLIGFIGLQISFCLLLFPSYVYLIAKQRDASSGNMPFATTTEIKNDVAMFQSMNQKIFALSRSMSSKSTQSILAELVTLKGQNISYTDIAYQNVTASSSTISLRGTADNREALLALEKRFQADASFQQVILPVSDFAKDKNIPFTLTMVANI